MKCPNCGGEVSVNDIKCPYCGTPNPEGIQFQAEVHRRRSFNGYLRDKIKEQMQMPLMQRILNLSIFFLILLLLIQLLMSLGLYLLSEGNVLAGLHRPKDYEEQMAQMYESGSYGELYDFMDRYGLEGEDYSEYMQMCLIHNSYQEFLYHSMNCMEALEQGVVPDDYHLRYAIESAEDLLNLHIPAYPDVYPENQDNLEHYCQEVIISLSGMFRLSRKEILTLCPDPEGSYDYKHDEKEQLEALARENLRKEGYTDEIQDESSLNDL